ncbi:hypothetical protein, partial [Streptobacillus moniliformis]|uniref:hypothetical protein n=4 Tax=Streptobacillus moniliformis TaxID=34105 RepID=UPI001E2E0239
MFLLLLSSLTYAEEEKNKISGEINFGINSAFGADGLEDLSRLIPSLVDTFKPSKNKDYGDFNIQDYSREQRDLELAIRYLSKNVELRKKLSVKLKENYVGLGLKVDIFGKKITHTKFLGNNE